MIRIISALVLISLFLVSCLPKPETIYGPGFQTTNPQQAQEAINLQKFQQQYIQPVSNIRESSSAITPKGSQIMQLVEELLRRRGMQ